MMDIFSLLWMMLGACLGVLVMALVSIKREEREKEHPIVIDRFTNLLVNEATARDSCPQCLGTWLLKFDDGLVYCPECHFEAQLPAPVETKVGNE
jgi:uncharacterized Zn finger protein (UPF0148 family)